MDASAEIQRLESNHAELLLHQETLAAQLQTKREQLKQIRTALSDCRSVLTSYDEQRTSGLELPTVVSETTSADADDVVMAAA